MLSIVMLYSATSLSYRFIEFLNYVKYLSEEGWECDAISRLNGHRMLSPGIIYHLINFPSVLLPQMFMFEIKKQSSPNHFEFSPYS